MTVKPDHAAQRAAQAQALAAKHLAQQAKADQAAAAKLAKQQAATQHKADQAAGKTAAHLLAEQNKAALTAARYAARHPELNYNGQAPTSINVTGGTTTTPGGATTGSDITPLAPGQTLQTGAGVGIDSSDTTQPGVYSDQAGNATATKPTASKSFYQQHKTAVIVLGVTGGIILVVGLYGYVKYRAITYPFRKAGKILGIVKSAGRAVGGVVRS